MAVRIPVALLAAVLAAASVLAATPEDQLLEAIRQSDVAAVKKLLDSGVSANVKYRYDRSALSFAADRGNVEVVQLLLDRGAAVDAQDTYYKMTPLSAAAMKGHVEILKVLLAKSTPAAQADALFPSLRGGKPEVVSAVLASRPFSPRDLAQALAIAEQGGAADIAAVLKTAGAVAPPKADFQTDPATLARYVGLYRGADDEARIVISGTALTANMRNGNRTVPLAAMDARNFQGPWGVTVEFVVDGERVQAMLAASFGKVERFERVEEAK
ncbi:MAG: ankyrin repeat domain-containing protein [Vicinamibacteria bacterium]